jgi:hypothetical protein
MLEILDLSWRFLAVQPFSRYVQLHPWHLQAVLMVLGLLAAAGIHHLIGYTFRFYNVRSEFAHWLGTPTLVVLLISVQALLFFYTLVTRADALVKINLGTEEAIQPASILGEILLDPAFSSEELAAFEGAGVSKERLVGTLRSIPAEAYRQELDAFRVETDRLVLQQEAPGVRKGEAPRPAPGKQGAPEGGAAAADAGALPLGNRAELATAIVVQTALRWLNDPARAWPQATAKQDAQPARPDGGNLNDFIVSLVDEIQDGVVLERLDWEHMAGHRFAVVMLHPMLVKYINRFAIAGVGGVLVLNLIYFFGFYRVRRWLHRERPSSGAKGAPASKE